MAEQTTGVDGRSGSVADRKQSITTTAAMGSTGSTVALAAYYLSACLKAGDLVAPSNEMLIVLVGAVAPLVHLVCRVLKAKADKWAAAQGVVSIALAMVLLAACAGQRPLSTQERFDLACHYADNPALEPLIPLVQGLLLAKFGEEASLAFQGFVSTVKTTCGQPLDLANAGAVIQRVYDAGGNIVALVAKSQAPAGGA